MAKLRNIEVGKDYKLRGERSRIDGRKAAVVTVISAHRVDSLGQPDSFSVTDGMRTWVHVKRTDLIDL